MSDDQEFTVFPEMIMLPMLVKKPEGYLRGPAKPMAAISVGAQNVPGAAPMLFLGMHHADGDVLVAALDAKQFTRLVVELAQTSVRIAAGAFDQPESTQ